MDDEVLSAIRAMLTVRSVLCLAATIDGEPSASLLPFASAPDFRGVYVQASTLARHSRALQPGATVGILIHEPDTGDGDPLQIPRLSLQATVEVVERDSEAFAQASEVFVGRFPSASITLELVDFTLYRLAFRNGRYVAGFAQAHDVGPGTFEAVSRL
jgi:putative heme iron utilization protein